MYISKCIYSNKYMSEEDLACLVFFIHLKSPFKM